MADKLKIVGISGSLRKNSFNTSLLRALGNLAAADMDLVIENLKGIPVYDGDDEAVTGVPQMIVDLADRIRSADGVIIATPEYNFSIPGGLKNATDWLSRVKAQPFKNKRVGIVGAAMGPLGTARVQYQLRQNLVGLEAQTMAKPEMFVGMAQNKFADNGTLQDADSESFFKTWLAAYTDWVRRDL